MRNQLSAFSFQSSVRTRKYLSKGSAFFLVLIACLVLRISPVHAQLEIADTYDIADTEVQSGDLVSLTSEGIKRSVADYDNKIFGVITTDPLAVYKRVDGTGSVISRNGIVTVNVTSANGGIKTGDYVTSSTIAGKGQKALASGYVIGVALKDFNEGEGTSIDFKQFENAESRKVSLGQIPVAVRIEYAEISTSRNANALLSRLNAALFSNVQDPEKFVNVIRYVASGLVIIFSILVGLFILARVVPKGVEGIGRNPLARHSIILYTGVNIVIVVVIIILGIGASLLLTRL
jgi:uncharacterized membrane protein YidH (DUF202 family)